MRVRNWEDFVEFDSEGRMIDNSVRYLNSVDLSGAVASGSVIETHPNGPTISSSLSGTEQYDLIPVELVAGQTYSWAYRGTAEGGIEDPLLALFASDGDDADPYLDYITEDDDGGQGRSSQITFTPTESGTYYLYATSWYTLAYGDPSIDTGDYTIVTWSPDAAHDAPLSFATTFDLNLGTNYAYIDTQGDEDMYSLEVTEGMVYTISYSGGISGSADWDDEPGENIGYLVLYDSSGNVLGQSVNYESGTSYWAEESGTIFVRVIPYDVIIGDPVPMTGGYTIDVAEVDPTTRDPLESLHWDSAANIPTEMVGGVPTATVYFAAAGEDVGTGEETFGWEQHQIDAVMHALNTQYTPITGINYVITTDIEEATFRMITVENLTYGARFYPNAPEYGDLAGIGSFNLLSGGFGSDPGSLLPGGYSYEVILHEFGHAHGVAHPHDTGGGSEVMLGVTASTGSFGVYDLNQGVYTVMSYNSGWNTHPDGDRNYSVANRTSGWNETLGAFDIAVLQDRYGTHDHNTGDTVYTIADTQEEATYVTIWDTGGNDTIAYSGERDARIDLLAATLDYTPTGGGVVSFVNGVWGGYTIANDVVIENATGGSGDDVLLGNSSDNVLTGNNGQDVLMGRAGDDTINGGNGTDALHGDAGNDTLNGGLGDDSLHGGEGDDTLNGGRGNDRLDGGSGNNTLNGGRGSDVFVFTEAGTNTISDYERGEDIDLSGLGVTSDDVTVLSDRIVVELGDDDLTILFDTGNFRMADLYFGEPESLESSSFNAGGVGDFMFA